MPNMHSSPNNNSFDYHRILGFVPYCMVAITVLLILMASYSQRNSHPDEYVHLNAIEYYKNYTIPPKACSPESIDSYSVYGFSRLDNFEISYFLNGKFSALIQYVPTYDYVKARFFNISLFIILMIMSIKIARFRLFTLPLILSPQIWYLFSYANSEPFSIFITIIVAYLFFDKQSMLHKVFDKSLPKLKKYAMVILLAIIASLSLFVKETFYFFYVFLFVAMCIQWRKQIFSLQLFKFIAHYQKIFVIFSLVVVTLSSVWVVSHEWVNDFNRSENMHECRLETAHRPYSPETPLEKTLPNLYLHAKGLPITFLLDNGWHQRLFYSAFGYYGYSSIPANLKFYSIIGILFVLFLFTMFIQSVKQVRNKNYTPLIFFLGMCGTFVLINAAALYKSWTGDFQPQGRYFFALIGVMGIVLHANKRFFAQKLVSAYWIQLIAFLLFLLSAFSFIFIGFTEIPKLL